MLILEPSMKQCICFDGIRQRKLHMAAARGRSWPTPRETTGSTWHCEIAQPPTADSLQSCNWNCVPASHGNVRVCDTVSAHIAVEVQTAIPCNRQFVSL